MFITLKSPLRITKITVTYFVNVISVLNFNGKKKHRIAGFVYFSCFQCFHISSKALIPYLLSDFNVPDLIKIIF